MIALTYTSIADFMLATSAAQRKTLWDYKYPDEDEPRARVLYYKEARKAISDYHEGLKTPEWLEERAWRIQQQADEAEKDRSEIRLRNNARALSAYARNFDSQSLHLLTPLKAKLQLGGVEIRVVADLHGTVKSRRKILRLEYGKEVPDARYVAIVSQLMYEAFSVSDANLSASAFVVRHIESARDFTEARKGARLWRDIQATCENIEAIWERL